MKDKLKFEHKEDNTSDQVCVLFRTEDKDRNRDDVQNNNN